MARRVLFHTSVGNVGLFSDAARLAGVAVRHLVRADLLEAAEAARELTPAIRRAAAGAMRSALGDAELLCTCSTLGPAADDLAAEGFPVGRVDRLLAERAVAGGGRIAVLYAVATTEEPTRSLFEDAASRAGDAAAVDLIHVAEAWPLYRVGDEAAYHRAIAAAVDRLPEGYDTVALAQASMAPAARLCGRPVLTSPDAAFG